ncbi:MAG: cytochrome ubiquinol oxidase subunit I [Calditrichaeota bacterium]|nr:cytochrome ubiquinol oxidase subunit I [Calditrichota bacterium]
MDALILARWQFAITSIYHFFFVPLTLGLSIFVAILETIYVKTGNEMYKRLTKFWGKLFVINFSIGVATGIVMEFQFGMNWSEYSRFVGDIFGAPLAIEALLAFFLESTFLGIWLFGWEKVSKKMHAAAIWLVAIGSNISALWILIANSFMQQPVGYVLRNGRAEMVDFFALIFNANVWVQFPHVVTGGMATAAFFVIGISIFHLVRKHPDEKGFQQSLKYGTIYGFVSVLLVMMVGHSQMQHMVRTQPMKVAAAEAIWETENPAGLSLFTVGNEAKMEDVFSIRVPHLVSILAFNSLEGEIKGIRNLQQEYEEKFGPGDYAPPIAVSYWSFRMMVGAGTLMLFLSFYTLFFVLRDKFDFKPWLSKLLLLSIALPYIANTTGWSLAEFGRQPWIVFGLMKTEDAVSKAVTGGEVLLTLLGFTLLYAILIIADVYLLKKYAVAGTQLNPQTED